MDNTTILLVFEMLSLQHIILNEFSFRTVILKHWFFFNYLQQQQTYNFSFLIPFFLSALPAGNGDINMFCSVCIKCPLLEFWSYLRYSGLNPFWIATANVFAIANSPHSDEPFWCWVLTYLIVCCFTLGGGGVGGWRFCGVTKIL